MGRQKKNSALTTTSSQNQIATVSEAPGIFRAGKIGSESSTRKSSHQLKEFRKILGKVKRPKMVSRPKTPWIFFLTRSYKHHKDTGGATPFKQFWTELSPRWKSMTEESKAEYVRYHEEDKVRYENEMKNLNQEDVEKIETYKRYCKLKKAAKKEQAPKPVITNYMAFARLERPKIRQETPNITFGELGKLLGARWKNASDETIAKCNAIVAKDRERYNTEMLQIQSSNETV